MSEPSCGDVRVAPFVGLRFCEWRRDRLPTLHDRFAPQIGGPSPHTRVAIAGLCGGVAHLISIEVNLNEDQCSRRVRPPLDSDERLQVNLTSPLFTGRRRTFEQAIFFVADLIERSAGQFVEFGRLRFARSTHFELLIFRIYRSANVQSSFS